MRRRWTCVLIVSFATACSEAEQPADPACASCHGSAANAAPPNALGGFAELDYIGVGAHQSHLTGGKIGAPVPCIECHVFPSSIDAAGHIDTPYPAEVIWGPRTKTGSVSPVWDRATMTCRNTYCHGGGIAAQPLEPMWTTLDGSQIACGSCHGLPPPPPHPANMACENCHAPVAGPNMTLADVTKHIDGNLDLDLQTGMDDCSDCHGDATSSAPPVDLAGMSDTSRKGVGAHRAHLDGGNSAPVACNECHVVPAQTNDPGHLDAAPAEVTFGALSSRGGANPTYDAMANTCSNTYCHGGSTPVWTTVDGSQDMCGSCHGLPPPPPHPGSTRCNNCHGATGGEGMVIDTPANHINGRTDFN